MRLLILLAVVLAAGSTAEEFPASISTADGFSGFPLLPSSELLGVGLLRVNCGLEYTDLESGGSILTIPAAATWGALDGIELCGGIPFYIDDDHYDEDFQGNLSLGGSYLYETARGGTALAFRGLAVLPTGSDVRDGVMRTEIGTSITTVFRQFKFTAASGLGVADPFDDDRDDYMVFSVGGSSFVSEGFQVAGAVKGLSYGVIDIAGTAAFEVGRDMMVFGTVITGLDGPRNYGLKAGLAWTGGGF